MSDRIGPTAFKTIETYFPSTCDHPPIIAMSNASFQYCPDTSWSTGGFMIHLQGGTIQEVTTSPQIICHSMGEAEYCCTAALAIMATGHLRKAFNEIKNRPSNSPLTIPIGIDLKAATNIASSTKETKKTCHIERRYHYFREQRSTTIQQSNNKLFQHIPAIPNFLF
jgi:hypothetical protein